MNVGEIVALAIPFRTFKERIRIVKAWSRKASYIRVYKSYVYLEFREEKAC